MRQALRHQSASRVIDFDELSTCKLNLCQAHGFGKETEEQPCLEELDNAGRVPVLELVLSTSVVVVVKATSSWIGEEVPTVPVIAV